MIRALLTIIAIRNSSNRKRMYDETKGGSTYEEMYSAHIMSCVDDRDCGLRTEQAGGARRRRDKAGEQYVK